MDNFIIAFGILLILSLLSRIIDTKGVEKLEQDKKVALIDLFSKSRVYTFGILIAIILLFFYNLRANKIEASIAYWLYIGTLLVFIFLTSLYSYKKLKENNFPDAYINSFLFATALRFLGLFLFIILIK